jgi:hypothetical protein
MEAGNISIQALDYVLGQDLDGLAQLREGLQSAQDKELVEFCHDLLRGAYEEAHKHPFVANLFSLDDASGDKVKENIATFIESAASEDEKERRREAVLLSGVYALLVFVQANWTGPDLHTDIRKLVPTQEYKEIALDSLLLDGETVYPLTRYLNFLQHARWILHDSFSHISTIKARHPSEVNLHNCPFALITVVL